MKKIITLIFVFFSVNCIAQTEKEKRINQLETAIRSSNKPAYETSLKALQATMPNDADVLYYTGFYNYFFEKNDILALQNFSRAIALKPTLGKAYIGRAKLLAEKGLYEKAAADISVIVDAVKSDAGLYILRGGYYFKNLDYPAALSDFLNAIALKPNNPDYYNEAANTYTAQGNSSAADALFAKGFTVSGMDVQTLQCYYGKYLVGQKRFAEAVTQYKKAFAGNPANLYSDDYNNAAIASYKTNDLATAERYADIAIKTDPDCVSCYLNGASVAIDRQDWSKLLTLARTALKLAPDNPNVNMLMAVGLSRTGNTAEGKQYQEKAKALHTKN